jgi:hypothetical protein
MICLILTVSCIRYSFSGSSLPAHIKSVSIPLFDNLTPKAGLEETIRERIWQSFQAANIADIKRENGDALLRLTLSEYINAPDAYDVSGNVRSYKVTLIANVDFFDNNENVSLYKDKITVSGTYNLSGETEEKGLNIAIGSLTEIVLNNTLRGF